MLRSVRRIQHAISQIRIGAFWDRDRDLVFAGSRDLALPGFQCFHFENMSILQEQRWSNAGEKIAWVKHTLWHFRDLTQQRKKKEGCEYEVTGAL